MAKKKYEKQKSFGETWKPSLDIKFHGMWDTR